MVKNNKPLKGKLRKAWQFFKKNRLTEARNICQQLCNVAGDNSGALFLLGKICMKQNNFSESEMIFSKVTTLDNSNYEAFHNKGLSQVYLNKMNDAFVSFRNALNINPEYVDGYTSMGCLLRDSGQYEQAEECFRKALELDPNHLNTLIHLANLLMFTSSADAADEYFKHAHKIDPKNIPAIIGIATVQEKKRNYKESYSLIKPLIDRGTMSILLAYLLASLADKVSCEKEAITMMQKLINSRSLAPIEKESMYFATGKLYDRLGAYEKAFSNIDKANKTREHKFNLPAFRNRINSVKSDFSPNLYAQLPVATASVNRPIFIIGMPRSGTSLIEQILATHTEITGGGELPYLDQLTEEAERIAHSNTNRITSLDKDTIQNLANRYTERLSGHANGSDWITDKMPMNYLHLGLIRKLFPESPIIHCVRNPLDICISCYFQNFGENHPYIFNLEMLGEVYNSYNEIMKYWKTELGIPMFDIHYESLVADPEKTVRELLDYCGLGWEDQCLSFYSSNRYVHTASYDQVSQPIYLSSVARWKNYEKQIVDLINIIHPD